LKSGNIVFVYKNNELVEGSPFSSFKKASQIIGISTNYISEYIDTNIEIKKFLFFSKKI